MQDAVRVQGKPSARDIVFAQRFLDELLDQLGSLPRSDHPAPDTATLYGEDRIEAEIVPLTWPEECGDVPTPKLI